MTGDFSFSLSIPAGTQRKAAAPRYIARPFEARPIGQETLILAAGSEATVRAPLFYAQMLSHCGRFRTLDDHADSIIKDFSLPEGQRAIVRQGLAGLVERDLLQDEQTVFKGLGSGQSAGDPPSLRTLCIRTCDRPGDLEQLLTSLDRHLDQTSLERVLVLDDSREPGDISATAEVIARTQANRAVDLIHIDRTARARLVDRMAAAAGVEHGQLRWLIEGDDDDPAPSYGANLNLALLLTAGERFVMIDDDATLDPHVLSPPEDSLSLREAHDFALHFPDPTRLETEQYDSLNINPIRAHARVLGAPVDALARAHGLQDGHLLANLSPQMIHDFTARPRVRLTTNGTLGDSGTGSMLWLYTLPPDQLSPWLEGEAAYRRLAFSRRVARSTLETQIASSVSLMTTTLTGVDNQELLLPVPAKGRGEDLIFGIGVRFLYPGTPCCAFPWMLPHRLESRRHWQNEDLTRRQGAGLTGYIGTVIENLAEAIMPTKPLARTALLAEWMQRLADMDDAELIEDLRRHLLQKRTDMAAKVGTTLDDLRQRQAPQWLQQEFSGIIERHLVIRADDTENLERLCPKVRHFAHRYGQALPTWIQVWQWAARVDVMKTTGQTR